MKILITGGCGFIGSNLVKALIKKGHNLVVIDNLSNSKASNTDSKAKLYKLDIRSPKLKGVLTKEKPDVIIHLAAQIDVRKSVEDPKFDFSVNVLGGLNLLEATRSIKVKHFIFASSCGVYGDTNNRPTPETQALNPASPYLQHKRIFENSIKTYSQFFGLKYTIFRYANVYGPGQGFGGEGGVIAKFIQSALLNKTITINGDGEQTRDFIYIEDIVNAHFKILNKASNTTYNLGTGIETSVNSVFNLVAKQTDYIKKPKYKKQVSAEINKSSVESEKFKNAFNYSTKIDFSKGVQETIAWFRLQQK